MPKKNTPNSLSLLLSLENSDTKKNDHMFFFHSGFIIQHFSFTVMVLLQI